MKGMKLSAAPSAVVRADQDRFGDLEIETVIQRSGLIDLTPDVARRYCHWYVGQGYGWKESRSLDDWRQGYGDAAQLETLADHLGLVPDERLRKAALHTMCKTGRVNGKPYHWTPYVAIDIDMRDHHSTESLRERYEHCVEALQTTPVVLRSPGKVLVGSPHHDGHAFGGHGLHLYFPLQVPVSIFGLTSTKVNSPLLVPAALQAEGVTVRSGWVEVYPTSTHTLRMPLAWGMAQLDPETLMPLPTLSRVDEVARLVASMDSAATSALDPFALAERFRQPRRSRVSVVSNGMGSTPARTAPKSARAGGDSIGAVDVERLEGEGLYPGVTRNEAALALARRRMLHLGLSAADTVEFLMEWSATMHNGLSSTAAKLPCPEATRRLRRQYERITRSILKAIATGKVVAGGGRRTGRPITDAEVCWIMHRASAITEPMVRYSVEVFLTCVIGFAKDRGCVAIGPARFEGADLIHAQIPATTMQCWPRCGSGQYRRWLTWAEDSEFTRMVRNYRHSQDPKRSRARTFEIEAELDGLSGVNVDAEALLRTAAATTVAGRAPVNPRQVEHALYVARVYGDGLTEVYGEVGGQQVKRLVAVYEAEIARSHRPLDLMVAA